MRRLGLVVGLVCLFLTVVLLTASMSQHQPTSLRSGDVTATYSAALAVQVDRILGSNYSVFQVEQAAILMAPSRTAIALTRDPSLVVSSTPDPIRLTAIHIGDLTPLQAFPIDSNTLTPVTALSCEPWLEHIYHGDLETQIQTALTEAGIYTLDVVVASNGIGQPADCGEPFYPFITEFWITIDVKSIHELTDEQALADKIATVLAVLPSSLSQEEFGSELTRLHIFFFLSYASRIIDTGYANALAAYEEGLRGEALLEALGGILPA